MWCQERDDMWYIYATRMICKTFQRPFLLPASASDGGRRSSNPAPAASVRTLSDSLNEPECNVMKCNVTVKCSSKKREMITPGVSIRTLFHSLKKVKCDVRKPKCGVPLW